MLTWVSKGFRACFLVTLNSCGKYQGQIYGMVFKMLKLSQTVHKEVNSEFKINVLYIYIYILLYNDYIFISTAVSNVSNQECKKFL